MLTYKFYVRTGKSNSVVLRLTNNRKKAEIAIGLQLSKDELDDCFSPNPKSSNLKWRSLLMLYQSRLDEIRCELLRDGRPNEDVKIIADRFIVEFLKNEAEQIEEAEGEFVQWFKRFADNHTEGSGRTRRAYLHTLSRLRAFDAEIDKKGFSDLTVAYLDSLDSFWSRTMSVNSRNHHMRNIRAVIKYAIRNDLDIRNPFDRFRIKREETRKRSLSIGELHALIRLEVFPFEEIYRDMFLLSFMLIGINPVDLYALDKITSQGRVDYRRAKTHKLYSIKVEPEALAIIEKYGGAESLLCLRDRWQSHDSFGKAANAALQSMGAPKSAPGRKRRGAGLFPELTLYWARHTWATIAAELDVPDAVISQALGHSSANPTTAIYIKRNTRKVDEANRRVLDYVFNSIRDGRSY